MNWPRIASFCGRYLRLKLAADDGTGGRFVGHFADDLDYANIIKVAFPLIKKKAETETAMWATVIRHINEPDESTIEVLLKLIPSSAREMLVKVALEKYKEEIPTALTSLAESKGLKLNITGVEISMG